MKRVKTTGFIGKRIAALRAMTPEELDSRGWPINPHDGPAIVIVLEDGSSIEAASDPEGNAQGCMTYNVGTYEAPGQEFVYLFDLLPKGSTR